MIDYKGFFKVLANGNIGNTYKLTDKGTITECISSSEYTPGERYVLTMQCDGTKSWKHYAKAFLFELKEERLFNAYDKEEEREILTLIKEIKSML
jgi:hypothetical protein